MSTKKEICPHCNVRLVESAMTGHLPTCEASRPFSCDICGRRFPADYDEPFPCVTAHKSKSHAAEEGSETSANTNQQCSTQGSDDDVFIINQDQIAANTSSESEIVDLELDMDHQPMAIRKQVEQPEIKVESTPPPESEAREEEIIPSISLEQLQEELQRNGYIPRPSTTEEDEAAEQAAIKAQEDMKKIILTQGQLKRLATELGDPATVRELVVGCFVRLNFPGLPEPHSECIFFDKIVDVLEPQSHQHLWLNRRFRLLNLGDFEAENVIASKVQDNELSRFFDYMEAKDEQLPTHEFVEQKAAALDAAFKALEGKAKAEKPAAKIGITCGNLDQITLDLWMLRDLAKLDYESFRAAVVGCFVFMPAIRKDKPKDCQYHIVRVVDCVRGRRHYKVRNVGQVNYLLVLPHYGKYKLSWMKSFDKLTEDNFQQWVEDMRFWNEPIPTMDFVLEKAAQLQSALGDAELIPTLLEAEKQRQAEAERSRRALLPVQSAKDLDGCCLTLQQLQRLAEIEDVQKLKAVLTGCFVRINSCGAHNKFELDQILDLEARLKPGRSSEKVLELKFAGTISLAALTLVASNHRLTDDQELKEYAKKLAAEGVVDVGEEILIKDDETLPTNDFVERKKAELKKALQSLGAWEEEPSTAKEHNKNVVGRRPSSISNSIEFVRAQSSMSLPGGKVPTSNGNGAAESNATANVRVQVKDGQLSVKEFRNILMAMKRVTDLMTCEKEVVARVLRGFYARIAHVRAEKPSDQQYYVDQITGVSWGGEPYRIRAGLLTDLRLHFKHIDQQPLSQLYRGQPGDFDDAFQLFIDDMRKWKDELPTLAQIERKNREFGLAMAKARNSAQSGVVASSFKPQQPSVGGGTRQQFQVSLPHASRPFEHVQQQQFQIQRQFFVPSSLRSTPGLPSGWMNSIAVANLQKQLQQQPILGNVQNQTTAPKFFSSSPATTTTTTNKRQLTSVMDENESWRIQKQQLNRGRGGGEGGMARDYEQQPRHSRASPDVRFEGAFSGSQPAAPAVDYRGDADVEILTNPVNLRDFPALQSVYQQSSQEQPYRRGGTAGTGYEVMEQLQQRYRTSSPAYRRREEQEAPPQYDDNGDSSSSSYSNYQGSYAAPSRPKRVRSQSPQSPPVDRYF